MIRLRASIKERKLKELLARQVARRERLEMIGKMILIFLSVVAAGGLAVIGVLIWQKQGAV